MIESRKRRHGPKFSQTGNSRCLHMLGLEALGQQTQITRDAQGPHPLHQHTGLPRPWRDMFSRPTSRCRRLHRTLLPSHRSVSTQHWAHPTNALVGPWGTSSYPSSGAGYLAGLRVAVKDNICTTSLPTTCSSRMLENFHSPFDATVVTLLSDNGAEIIGKANCDEFGMG